MSSICWLQVKCKIKKNHSDYQSHVKYLFPKAHNFTFELKQEMAPSLQTQWLMVQDWCSIWQPPRTGVTVQQRVKQSV